MRNSVVSFISIFLDIYCQTHARFKAHPQINFVAEKIQQQLHVVWLVKNDENSHSRNFTSRK